MVDYRRVFFDDAVGAFREDRPLEFFDGASDRDHYNPVRSFGVSESGQTLAATVCHAGFCEIEPVGGESGPSADTELRLWVSHDGGGTWEDQGQLLPQTRIIEVTDDDVLVRTRNIWRTREHWQWLTDEEWDAMLARLAPLGLEELEGRAELFRWAASGETYPQLPEPTPPTVGRVDWRHIGERPDGADVWTSYWEYRHLLAIADPDGSPRIVYATEEWLGGSFITNDLLIRSRALTGTPVWIEVTTMEFVDLATARIHEVDGLRLPFGLDIESADSQDEYYRFITARPAPITPARAAIELTPITRGEPRPLPEGIALFYWLVPCMACGGVPFDLRRVVLDEAMGSLREDRPLAIFDGANDIPNYYPIRSFGVSTSGQTMAVAVCHAAYCDIDPWDDPPYPGMDTELRLWVTGDGGGTWENRGQLLPETRIIEVTDDDVLVYTWNIWDTRWDWLTEEEWDEMLARLGPLGLGEREGWRYRYQWVASGERVDPPAVRTARNDKRRLLKIEERDGSIGEYISTHDLEGPFAGDDLLIRPTYTYHDNSNSHLAYIATADIVDLTTSSVHEVEGFALPLGFDLEAGKQQGDYYLFITARPAPVSE